VRKPHGVRGEASIEPWTDSTERFAELEHVWLVSPDEKSVRASRIESTRTHAGRALLKFADFDSPESLAAIRDWTIEIAATDARDLDEDEYFLHDLIGLRLVDAEGRDRGEVVDVSEGGGGLLFDVKRADGGHFDLPFAASICTNIDIAAKRMTVELPEGIDELDRVDSVEGEARKSPKQRPRSAAPEAESGEPQAGAATDALPRS
jgi:16S rRNA processing protein RimM